MDPSKATCPNCGRENEAGFRFCPACGVDLEMASQAERRQLATLLFCDVSGSTAMGERLDAESVREIMSEYFHEMRLAIERHGGTVEKFIGDAVMAIFGVPAPHEDDPIRAVRAAWEMQQRVPALNDELGRRLGSWIALRIGVNTGEVVAGDASTRQSILTGDAVNVAARLEQAAAIGEVLLGDATYRLVRDSVFVEPVQSLAMKGKAEPVAAHRLLGIESPSGRPPRRWRCVRREGGRAGRPSRRARVRHRGAPCETKPRRRDARGWQEPARFRVPRRRGRVHPAGKLPPVRGGHHLVAVR